MFGNKKSTQKEVVEKVNIGFTSNGKIAVDTNLLIKNDKFREVVKNIFDIPCFLIKKYGNFIEFPINNDSGFSKNVVSYIRVYDDKIMYISYKENRVEEQEKIKIERVVIDEFVYDFVGLDHNKYSKNIEFELVSIILPYAKIAYFVEELIENKIISRDGVIGPIFRKHAVAVK